MQRLIDGYKNFKEEDYPQYAELYESLALAQQPVALVITCSDSRVEPSRILQSDPGQLFVMRNAGNLVPESGGDPGGAAATIEFAVEVLGIEQIIVCGHSNCGAMAAVQHPAIAAKLAAVRAWIDGHGPERIEGASVDDQARANVKTQLERLARHPAVAAAMKENRLELHGWFFDIGPASLSELDRETGEFSPLD